MRHIVVLVSSFSAEAPVKGAVALANALAPIRQVTLVALRGGSGFDAPLDNRVTRVSLEHHSNPWRRARVYREMLAHAGGRDRVASISIGLSPDLVNATCGRVARTCSSVRGNLPRAYRRTYGVLGGPVGAAHLVVLRRMDHVTAMTTAMARQVSRYTGRAPALIGNFVDEAALERHRDTAPRGGALRFVFLGWLTSTKRPDAVIEALAALRRSGLDARLDVAGDGPMRVHLEDRVRALGLGDAVTIHGHIRDPFPILARADAFVLPSWSEGLSRAALEALYLGVPCVLRDVDGNAELVQDGVNGAIFSLDSDLPAAMQSAARFGRGRARRESLLPEFCRQHFAATRYLDLLESP